MLPTGTAFFDTSNTTSLTFWNATAIGGWTFNAGASAYTFSSSQAVIFNGAGIVINGGSANITSNLALIFNNSATAGAATITNGNILEFNSSSSAGTAAITNNHELDFNSSASASSATITNSAAGTITFNNTTTGGSAAITNAGFARHAHTLAGTGTLKYAW